MRKKNMGFTLVELLAVIVIIGILAVLTLPTILGLFGKNTDKMYISDANKLISQAEYKIRAASTTINKPGNGDAIVLSMSYLDNNDFDNPPNKGSYLKEASYVVVYNKNGKYEYYAYTIEKRKKGGYRGVELSSSSELNARNATKHVKDMTVDDVYYVDEESKTRNSGSNYIKDNTVLNKLFSKKMNIQNIEVYNKESEPDDVTDSSRTTPKITSLSLSSNESSNKKNVNLSVTVDYPNDYDNLYIAYKIMYKKDPGYTNGDENFPEVIYDASTKKVKIGAKNNDAANENNEPVIEKIENSKSYIKSGIKFSKDSSSKNKTYLEDIVLENLVLTGGDDNTEATIYVVVYDKEGKSSARRRNYVAVEDKAPTITQLTVDRSDINDVAYVKITLTATDDLDSYQKFKVCTKVDSDNYDDCEWQDYASLVKPLDSHKYDYILMCGGVKCSPSVGSATKKKIYVFIKDSNDNIGFYKEKDTDNKYIEYEIPKNNAPTIKLDINEVKEQFFTRNLLGGTLKGSSLVSSISVEVNDDLTTASKLQVFIEEVNKDGNEINTIFEGTYSDYLKQNFDNYVFSGGYDGGNRYIRVTAKDEHDGETTIIRPENGYNVYKNQAPEIKSFNVTSGSNACTNSELCANTNSLSEISATFNINDDYATYYKNHAVDTSKDALSYCLSVSDPKGTYSANCSYETYAKNINSAGISLLKAWSRTISSSKDYDGRTITFKLKAKDAYGLESEESTFDYKIYKNQGPVIDNNTVKITSTNSKFNVSKFKIVSTLKDDFKKSATYTVSYSTTKDGTYTQFKNSEKKINHGEKYEATFDLGVKKYEGQTYYIKVTAKDADGVSTSKVFTYKLYNDVSPVVKQFDAEFIDKTDNIDVSLSVYDPFDTFKYCIDEYNDTEYKKHNKCKDQSNYNGPFQSSSDTKNLTVINDTFKDFKFDITFDSTAERTSDKITLPSSATKLYLHVYDTNGGKYVTYSTPVNYNSCEFTENIASLEETKSTEKVLDSTTCSGRCYYFDTRYEIAPNDMYYKEGSNDAEGNLCDTTDNVEEAKIFAFASFNESSPYYIKDQKKNYKINVLSYDIRNGKSCSSNIDEDGTNYNCNIKTCFNSFKQSGSNYVRVTNKYTSNIIGIKKFEYTDEEKSQLSDIYIGNKTIKASSCTGYYKLYTYSVTDNDIYGELVEKEMSIDDKKEMCDAAIDYMWKNKTGKYYLNNTYKTDRYVRADDLLMFTEPSKCDEKISNTMKDYGNNEDDDDNNDDGNNG